MAMSVSGAFTEFRRDFVDLDPGDTATARSSRNYLQSQIVALPGKDSSFPRLTGDFVASGSFARRTKIRPLDDIDFFAVMHAEGATEVQQSSDPRTYWLKPGANTQPLSLLTDDCGYISSTRVMNKFKSGLADVANYAKAEIKRDGEALRLKLTSYDWNFDIVPALAVNNAEGNVSHYLMPNGRGDWMRSDPRKDSSDTSAANQKHNGYLLPLIRLVKYWNARPICPRLQSYYIETLCLKVFENKSALTSLTEGVRIFFQDAPTWLWLACPDPKGFGPNLDENVDASTKLKVSDSMNTAAANAVAALRYQQEGKVRDALVSWKAVFGPNFPQYDA